jgi:predicted P-loop ATPase
MTSTFKWESGAPPADYKQVKSPKPGKGNGEDKQQFRLSILRTTQETRTYFASRVRFNILTNSIELRSRKEPYVWDVCDANAVAGLYLELSTAIHESADKSAVTDTVRAMARENQFNPLIDYFTGLRNAEADEYKFNNLATWAFGPKMKSPHADEVLKYFLVAAVARTFEPGTYYRCCPILMGEREVGKSFIAELCPFDLGNVTEPQNNKYAIDQVLVAAKQSLILEIGEVDAFCSSVPTPLIKNFISATRSHTPIKNKNSEKFVRSWVVYGTSNKANFIQSDLAQRFLPINLFHLKRGEFYLDDENAMRDNRDGIWAAAVQEYFANWVGKAIKYRKEVIDDLCEELAEFSAESGWYTDCVEYLNFENRIFLTREEVKTAIETPISNDSLNGFMQKHNWSQKVVKLGGCGKQQRLFVHPRHNQHESYQAAYVAEAEHRPLPADQERILQERADARESYEF